MKSLLKFTCVAAVALLFFSACSEKESNHIYQTGYQPGMNNTDDGKTRYEMITSYIESVDPDYFTKQHTYFGYEADTDVAAWKDFYNTCQKIDTAVVANMLVNGEQFHLMLYEVKGEYFNQKGALSWIMPAKSTDAGN